MSAWADLFEDEKSEVVTPSAVDRLVEDPQPISSQKYVLWSFADPRPSTLEKKELFIMERFLKWFYTQSLFHGVMTLMTDTLKATCDEATLNALQGRIESTLQGAVLGDRMVAGTPGDDVFDFSLKTLHTRYADYRALHQEDDTQAFQAALGTAELVTQGVKFRGAFATLEEASERAQWLKQRKVEPYIDVFAAEGFKWVPRNPYPGTGPMQVQYTDDQGKAMSQLNELMKEYQVQDQKRRDEFMARKESQRASAVSNNKKVKTPSYSGLSVIHNESENTCASASASTSSATSTSTSSACSSATCALTSTSTSPSV